MPKREQQLWALFTWFKLMTTIATAAKPVLVRAALNGAKAAAICIVIMIRVT